MTLEKTIKEEDIQTTCMNGDSIKRRGIYYRVGLELVQEYIREARLQGFQISNGLCNTCYESMTGKTRDSYDV